MLPLLSFDSHKFSCFIQVNNDRGDENKSQLIDCDNSSDRSLLTNNAKAQIIFNDFGGDQDDDEEDDNMDGVHNSSALSVLKVKCYAHDLKQLLIFLLCKGHSIITRKLCSKNIVPSLSLL